MQEAAGGGAEQLLVTVKDNKSDKTPAEIAEAVKAGKQVVLRRISDPDYIETGFLVSIVNDIASFCLIDQITDGTANVDPIFSREWVSILSDKTVKANLVFNAPSFAISADANGKYTSKLSPDIPFSAAEYGCGAGVFLKKDDGLLFGTINVEDLEGKGTFHIYFPDYAKKLIYDLKWNNDENPSTYTFTELSLGGAGGGPLTVNVTFDSSTKKYTADKTFEQINTAFLSGRTIQCLADLTPPFAINYCQFGQDGFDFCFQWLEYGTEVDSLLIVWKVVRITQEDEVESFSGNLLVPGGFPLNSTKNKILKTNTNGAMEYVDADTYLVKQPTTDEKRKFLSTDDFGNQVWADPLTAGNNDSVIIKSSTPNSTKKFRITVDDAGAITATEVV